MKLNEIITELEMMAPKQVYVRLADGSYIMAQFRSSETLTGGSKAGFIKIFQVSDATSQKLSLDQRLEKGGSYSGSDQIAGTPYGNRMLGFMKNADIHVVDFNPTTVKGAGEKGSGSWSSAKADSYKDDFKRLLPPRVQAAIVQHIQKQQ